MSIRLERLRCDIDAIARCTATPGAGATRPTMSPAWAEARWYVINEAQAIGCDVHVDAAGNVHARPRGIDWDTPAWLVGSHLDSVPNGGDFDGVVGVVLALELLRSASEDGRDDLPVELVVFAEEEGPTFGLGMLGSRAFVGELNAKELGKLFNSDGASYLEAGRAFGVDPQRLDDHRLNPDAYRGLIELHIEQGPGLWRRDQHLGVVRAIAGRRQFEIAVEGEANHAGATAMGDRRDALVGAAEMALALENIAPALHPDAVLTVGRFDVEPNAVNVVPGRVSFTIDFRAPADDVLAMGESRLREALAAVSERRQLAVSVERIDAIPARPMSTDLVDAMHVEACACTDSDVPVMMSGALHDAAVVAPHLPTVMLFVPSRDGVSHNPSEFSRIEDVALAAELVERFVRRITIDELNTMRAEVFVTTCGGAFEHSPWIVERAAEFRPFEDFEEMMSVMAKVIEDAAKAERLSLIRAHPDLVGRLSRSGQLTIDSDAEQRQAGLDDVSSAEIAQFDQYNHAYHEKFGFPFVICARENRKGTILKEMPKRLLNSGDQEMQTALHEIIKIARFRLLNRLWLSESNPLSN
ncbi:MAG: 2-oxo-4-hydroxy-4-carboxy-5-ureidoimidazoline decarboxylase, partial [Planctomycetota bacterium]